SALRFTEGGVLLVAGLALLWALLSLFGRITTVSAVAEEFKIKRELGLAPRIFSSLLGLNFLRAASLVAAITCAIGAVLISGSVWASTRASVQDVTRLAVAVAFITWIAWEVLNWFLSTAGLFAVVDGNSTFDAIASAVRLCQE